MNNIEIATLLKTIKISRQVASTLDFHDEIKKDAYFLAQESIKSLWHGLKEVLVNNGDVIVALKTSEVIYPLAISGVYNTTVVQYSSFARQPIYFTQGFDLLWVDKIEVFPAPVFETQP